ncbi:MAG: hypothetical protein AAF604_23930 [Acidobacteriota bacterium]
MRARISTPAVLLATVCCSALVAAEQSPAASASAVRLEFPLGVAVLADGVVLISERGGHRVQRYDPATGEVRVVAGTGEKGFSGDGGPATEARLGCPDSIDADADGNLYIADRCNHRIRRVDAESGIITTVAGNGERAVSGDGPALERSLYGPYFVNADSPGEVLFTDTDSHRVRRLDLESGRLETLAGSGEGGFAGDGGSALDASLARPHVALRARNGDLIIGDSFNQRIRRVDGTSGVIRTIAGRGERGSAKDGDRALDSPFGYFGGILEEENGDLLLTEWVNGRLLRLEKSSGILRVLAGDGGEPNGKVDGGDLLGVSFGSLADFSRDARGRLLVVAADTGRLHRIDLESGRVETLISPPD